ncbi:MAG TPA: hypothetical protein VHF46_06135 [Rubrobacteraceae bacterium]|nr:hypothetical protein [Rubrobacteraceae bacterium]
MHGIVRERTAGEEVVPSYTNVHRVVVRYADGRTVTFVPEAGREDFSEDDMHELAKMFARASSAAEWSELDYIAGG